MPALTDIESKLFSTKDFLLENGETLPLLELAYETYGSLNAKADNAVLVVHGYTSSHHAAGKYSPADAAAGSWDGLIGPGKTARVTVTFHRKGRFPYLCTVPGHAQAGMKGVFTVR